ncbi:MAG: Fic family protein [PVC group bacterium]
MKRTNTGEYIVISRVGEEVCRAFVPEPLPPQPPLELAGELREKTDQALISLGRLDGISALLPDPSLFLYMYVRKEAVLSSQIEGTQSSLSDLLLYESEEAPGLPLEDVSEVSNYVASLNHGLKRLSAGFPLSNRLLKEIHRILLRRGRGSAKETGEFRRSQNWIGGTRPGNALFIPPPPDRVPDCMSRLERFLHDQPSRTPVLLKVALIHGQFESIHPFLDGNGRVGRLLITLILCAEGVLRQPLLYLSLYFKRHREAYYDLLQGLRTEGEWERWLIFFMEGLIETAESAVATARKLGALLERDRHVIQGVGKAAGSALRVHRVLEKSPILSIGAASRKSDISVPTTTSSLKLLEKLKIVKEVTGRRRGRLFAYTRYINLLGEGT